jgi:hypothetical protein
MATAEGWKQMLTAILGVFVALASLLLIAWTFYKGAERTQQAPRLRRVGPRRYGESSQAKSSHCAPRLQA